MVLCSLSVLVYLNSISEKRVKPLHQRSSTETERRLKRYHLIPTWFGVFISITYNVFLLLIFYNLLFLSFNVFSKAFNFVQVFLTLEPRIFKFHDQSIFRNHNGKRFSKYNREFDVFKDRLFEFDISFFPRYKIIINVIIIIGCFCTATYVQTTCS